MKKLFSSYDLGPVSLGNRILMAPMTRSRAIDNVPNDLMAEYYGQRAGAGLIITEGTSPSPNGLGYPRIPGNFTKEQAAGWRKVTDAVHENGGKIFLQIMHTGRVTHPDNLPAGGRVLAPSPVALNDTKMYVDGKGELEIPLAQEMTIEDCREAIEEYVTCAKLALEAGFDGVELHAANGYLLEQFLHAGTNKRKDIYGGSIENRLKFVRDVTEAVVAAVGNERVGMRVSPYGAMNETGEFEGVEETHIRLAEILNEIGLVYLHVVDHEAMGAPAVPDSIKQQLRETFKGTLILAGGYDEQRAQQDLEAGKADLIAIGRPFISNPDLVDRFQQNARLATYNMDTFYTPGAEGYTDYPVLSEAEKKDYVS
ncbi:alkene reductase [Lewinellaceae bacterium SD302]|nr:alkene reductase [Lewinellaceae bacterium SD302]